MFAMIGFVFFIAGAVAGALAAVIPTTVGNVHNIGLLTQRVCLCIASGSLLMMGCILLSAGGIIDAIRAQRYDRRIKNTD